MGASSWNSRTWIITLAVTLGSVVVLAIAYRIYRGRRAYVVRELKGVRPGPREVHIGGGTRGGGGGGGGGMVKYVVIFIVFYIVLAYIGIVPSFGVFSGEGNTFGFEHGMANSFIGNDPDDSGWDVRTVGTATVLGGVIGFMIGGGPIGAVIGASIGGSGAYGGSMLFSLFDSISAPEPQLNYFVVPTFGTAELIYIGW